jgi:hypothetical protein
MGKSVRDAPSPKKPPIVAGRVLRHPWGDAPRGWARSTLVIRWRLRDDGSVWSTVEDVLDRQGRSVARATWPDDLFPEELPEVDGRGRPIRVQGDLSYPDRALEDWLVSYGRAVDVTPTVQRP